MTNDDESNILDGVTSVEAMDIQDIDSDVDNSASMHAGDSDDPRSANLDVVVRSEWGGGLYNVLFGDGLELGRGWLVVYHLLKINSEQEWWAPMRYRDAWIEEVDGELRLAVHTRMGKDYPDFDQNFEEKRAMLRAHPCYLSDRLWEDETYQTFYFKVPDPDFHDEADRFMIQETVDSLMQSRGGETTPRDIDALWREGPKGVDPDRLRKVGEQLAGQMLASNGMSGDAIIEVVDMSTEEGQAKAKQLRERYGIDITDKDAQNQILRGESSNEIPDVVRQFAEENDLELDGNPLHNLIKVVAAMPNTIPLSVIDSMIGTVDKLSELLKSKRPAVAEAWAERERRQEETDDALMDFTKIMVGEGE